LTRTLNREDPNTTGGLLVGKSLEGDVIWKGGEAFFVRKSFVLCKTRGRGRTLFAGRNAFLEKGSWKSSTSLERTLNSSLRRRTSWNELGGEGEDWTPH